MLWGRLRRRPCCLLWWLTQLSLRFFYKGNKIENQFHPLILSKNQCLEEQSNNKLSPIQKPSVAETIWLLIWRINSVHTSAEVKVTSGQWCVNNRLLEVSAFHVSLCSSPFLYKARKKKRKQIEREAVFLHLDLYITQCVMSLLSRFSFSLIRKPSFFSPYTVCKGNECHAVLLYLNIRGHYKEHKK